MPPFLLLFRYYAIVHPLKAQYLCTISKAQKTVLVAWIAAFILGVPIIFVQVGQLQAFLRYRTSQLDNQNHASSIGPDAAAFLGLFQASNF